MININKLVVISVLLSLVQSSCAPENKHKVPSFVSNKKPDTHFFEQVIHKKNSTEVLFYFKFNYKRNELKIYRPEHSDVGIELTKRLSVDSTTLHIGLCYFKKKDKILPFSRQKKGETGIDKSFDYSDEPDWKSKNYASSSRAILLAANGGQYELVHVFIEDEDDVNGLRYFVFDENPKESYFFRFNDGEETIYYPKAKSE